MPLRSKVKRSAAAISPAQIESCGLEAGIPILLQNPAERTKV